MDTGPITRSEVQALERAVGLSFEQPCSGLAVDHNVDPHKSKCDVCRFLLLTAGSMVWVYRKRHQYIWSEHHLEPFEPPQENALPW